MFNLGFTEMLAIAVIAIVFIGPKQLPAVARTIGKILGEIRRVSSEFTNSFTDIAEESNKVVSDLKAEIHSTKDLIEKKQKDLQNQIENLNEPEDRSKS